MCFCCSACRCHPRFRMCASICWIFKRTVAPGRISRSGRDYTLTAGWEPAAARHV